MLRRTYMKRMKKMDITVVGMGYVGLANATLLSQHNNVTALEVIEERVNDINNRISPIQDAEVERYFETKELHLKATTDKEEAYGHKPKFVVVAAPTNYDEETNYFDTKILESVIEEVLEYTPESVIIIKSTVPVGYTEKMKEKCNTENIIFSPEFLREGKALYDNLYPSRIILGEDSKRAHEFTDLLVEGAEAEEVDTLFMASTEAEAVKLFANTYL